MSGSPRTPCLVKQSSPARLPLSRRLSHARPRRPFRYPTRAVAPPRCRADRAIGIHQCFRTRLAGGARRTARSAHAVQAGEGRPHLHHRQHARRAHAARRLAGSVSCMPASPNYHLIIRNLGFSGDEVGGYTDKPDSTSAPIAGLRHAATSGSPAAPRSPSRTRSPTRASVNPNRFETGGHQRRRDLRLLRLQRVVRRRGGSAEVQERPGSVHQAHAVAEVQRQVGPAAGAVLADRVRGPQVARTCPTGKRSRINKNLELYTKAMGEVAKANGVQFVDLFASDAASSTPQAKTAAHHQRRPPERRRATRCVAEVIDDCAVRADTEATANLGRARRSSAPPCIDKNFHWFHRYRVTDGYSTFGGRAWLKFADGQTNYEVVQRELEILDIMTANRDKVIWAAAQGKDDQARRLATCPPLRAGHHQQARARARTASTCSSPARKPSRR